MTYTQCFDAGSVFCPCALADLGACVSCSLLRGEQTCTCGWSGMCIYAEYVRGGTKVPREVCTGDIVSRTDIPPGFTEGAFTLTLRVPIHVALWCDMLGSFILARPLGSPERYNVPLGAIHLREDLIGVAVSCVGPKTKALHRACAEGNSLTITGPFWSGLQGSRTLSTKAGLRVLVVAKGIAQLSSIQTARQVIHRGGSARVLLGSGSLGAVFAEDEVRETGAEVEIMPKTKDHNMQRVFAIMCRGEYDAVVSHGSDKQHRSLYELALGLERPPSFVWSSNLTMACAEGICGACLVDGFRGCKARLPQGLGFST